MRLAAALASLPASTFERLCQKRGIVLDPQKKISAEEQAARALAFPQEILGYATLPEEKRRALRLFAGAKAGLTRQDVGAALLQFLDAALVFAVPDAPDRFAMPSAYRVQIPATSGDDPRSARVLLRAVSDDALHAIASFRLEGPRGGPRSLVLGELLEFLEDPAVVDQAVRALQPKEQRLLEAIVARGGEVDTAELLDLSREPGRYTSMASELPKRSLGHGLMKQALLLPFGSNRWIVPTEVGLVIERERHEATMKTRVAAAARLREADVEPARAKFAGDPGPIAVALLAGLLYEDVDLTREGGAPRTALRRVAKRNDVEDRTAELLVAIARAESISASEIAVRDIGANLLRAWQRGGAWDESRVEPDLMRSPDRTGLASPAAPLRTLLLETLGSIPEGRFVSEQDLLAAVRSDLRADTAEKFLKRARAKAPDAFVPELGALFAVLLDHSLPTLGATDRGLLSRRDEGPDAPQAVRLSARARRWIRESESPPPAARPRARWMAAGQLQIDDSVSCATAIALGLVARVWSADGSLFAEIDQEAIERALRRGETNASIRERLAALVGSLDAPTEAALAGAARSQVRAGFVSTSAYITISDRDALAAILADDRANTFFVFPSPEGALLARPDISVTQVSRFLRRFGVVLEDSAPHVRTVDFIEND